MPTESLLHFLTWSGTTAGLGAVIALLTERAPAFQRLSKKAKANVVATLCITLPLLSWAVLRFVPAAALNQIDPIFQQLVVGLSVLLTWLASQSAHWADTEGASHRDSHNAKG